MYIDVPYHLSFFIRLIIITAFARNLLTYFRHIAWSKWGSIASIASNGTALNLQNLRCNPSDGSWSLTEPLPLPRIVEADVPLKHLVWNPSGSDLAVIDSAGRVAILSLFNSLNRPTMSKNSREDPADDLQRVVGCYWLNLAPLPPNRPVCCSNIEESCC